MQTLPNDPVMLLSFMNTQLRDFYPNLDDFCKTYSVSKNEIISKLKTIDYDYDAASNQFI